MAHFLLSTTIAYEIEFAIKNNSLLFEQSVFKFQSQLYFDSNSQYSFRIFKLFHCGRTLNFLKSDKFIT